MWTAPISDAAPSAKIHTEHIIYIAAVSYIITEAYNAAPGHGRINQKNNSRGEKEGMI